MDTPTPSEAPHRSSAAAAERLGRARVLLVGLEPWGVAAAVDLAAAGLGALHVADDRVVTGDDLLGARAFTGGDLGRGRAAALWDVLAQAAPGCDVSTGPLIAEAEGTLRLAGARWDLVITALPADDLLVHRSAARFAHADGAPSIGACLEGLLAVVGPAVIPGETACWECARHRRLANSPRAAADREIHAAFLAERPARRTPTYLAPTAGLLGHMLAAAALEQLTTSKAGRPSPGGAQAGSAGGSRLAGKLLVRDLTTLRTSIHTVLRLPWCDVCGGARDAFPPGTMTESAGRNLDEARDPAELMRMLAGVVDARTGIVQRLTLDAPDPVTHPPIPRTATAVLGDHGGSHCHARCADEEPEMGAGKGLTAMEALVRAAGEAVERYSAARFDPAEQLRASVAKLEADGIDLIAPDRLALYSDAQLAQPSFPYVRLAREAPIDWTPARWIDTGSEVMVPALPAFFDYHVPPAEQFCQVTSSGLAAAATREGAALRAAVELIERDSFTLAWLARLPGRRIELDASVGPELLEVARQLAAHGARVELYLLDAGIGVPTVLSAGFGDGSTWPGATVAIAAHLSPRTALRKSLLELAHVGPYLRRHMVTGDLAVPACPDDVHTLLDHAAYYFPVERARAFDFLRLGGSVRAAALEEPSDLSLATLAGRVRAAGLRIAVVDVTSADLAGTPFRVARALGPEFQQIHFGHTLARLGNPRLLALARGGINPDPHPMA